MIKNRVLLLPLFCFALISTHALADPFRLEGDLAYLQGDENGVERTTQSAAVTWWLEPVDHAGLPWREAGFVSRASSITVGYGRTRIEQTLLSPFPFGPPATVDLRDDTEQLLVSGRYVFPAKRWFVDGAIGRIESDASASGSLEPEGEEYSIGMGYYLTPTTTLRLAAKQGDLDAKDQVTNDCAAIGAPFFGCVQSISIQQETQTTEIALSFRHLGRMASFDYVIDLSAGSRRLKSESEISLVLAPPRGGGLIGVFPRPGGSTPGNPVTRRDSDTLGPLEFALVSARWYPADTVGIGASLAYSEREAPSGDGQVLTYGLDADWFILPQLAVSALWRRERAPVSGLADMDVFGASLRLRW